MLENKILEATQMIKDLEKKSKHARKNPSREARLLHALKPFMAQANHKALDDTVDMLHLMETMRSISVTSIQPSGIYDVDEECLRKKPLTH